LSTEARVEITAKTGVEARKLSKFACPLCNSRVVRRTRRHGFWQKFVLCRMGIYPWVCRECKHHFVLGSRRDDSFGYVDDPKLK
jgi:ribosomal protein L37AE/L43A